MEFKDYYKILGVERTADQKAISQAFRNLARRHHPDVNPGDKNAERRFKEINEAYQILNDPEKRARYDQVLDLRKHGGGWEDLLRRGAGWGADGGTFTFYGSPEDLGQFSEFFQQFFGGSGGPGGINIEDVLRRGAAGRTRERQAAGGDVEGAVEITLEEAYHGTQRTVTVPAGERRRAHSVEVKIAKGVQSGQRIRAAGQGKGGDLYLTVQIAPHPVFTRHGDDLSCEVAVPVWTAALGGEVEAPTPGGRVTMKIPAGTQDGQTFRLRGQGMPRLRGGGAGDEMVKVRLTLPSPLTERDRQLFEEMQRLHEGKEARR